MLVRLLSTMKVLEYFSHENTRHSSSWFSFSSVFFSFLHNSFTTLCVFPFIFLHFMLLTSFILLEYDAEIIFSNVGIRIQKFFFRVTVFSGISCFLFRLSFSETTTISLSQMTRECYTSTKLNLEIFKKDIWTLLPVSFLTI